MEKDGARRLAWCEVHLRSRVSQHLGILDSRDEQTGRTHGDSAGAVGSAPSSYDAFSSDLDGMTIICRRNTPRPALPSALECLTSCPHEVSPHRSVPRATCHVQDEEVQKSVTAQMPTLPRAALQVSKYCAPNHCFAHCLRILRTRWVPRVVDFG